MNKLFEKLSMQAIAESDAYTRFRTAADRDEAKRGLDTLEMLDKHFDR